MSSIQNSLKKKRNKSFYHKCKPCIVWKLVHSKNYFNLMKIFVLRLFKMMQNQTGCFRLKQMSVIKFLVAVKWKPCEIYRKKMCNVHEEVYFSKNKNKKIFTNGLNMGLLWARVKKTQSIESIVKRFQAQQSVKTVMQRVFWDMKRSIDFLEKGASYCQFLRQYSPYLLNDPHIYLIWANFGLCIFVALY